MKALIESVKRIGIYQHIPTLSYISCDCGKQKEIDLPEDRTKAYRLHVKCSCNRTELFLVESMRSQFSRGIEIKIWRFQHCWENYLKNRKP